MLCYNYAVPHGTIHDNLSVYPPRGCNTHLSATKARLGRMFGAQGAATTREITIRYSSICIECCAATMRCPMAQLTTIYQSIRRGTVALI